MQKRYRTFGEMMRERFGCRVQKVCVDAGFTCPNRDGSKGRGGCTFCNNKGFSHNTRKQRKSIRKQMEEGIEYTRRRYKAERFIAYFQPYSNTYGPVDVLKEKYDEALAFPDVVVLSVGTRPDCVSTEVLDLLAGYSEKRDVWIEYGVQTVHNRTLERVNRCETFEDFERAMEKTISRPLFICLHVILGLPGESRGDMIETARALSDFSYHSLKIHLLHIMKDTLMAKQHEQGEIATLSQAEYAERVVDFLEYVPPTVSIQRLSADAPSDILIAPQWCLDRAGTIAAIDKTMSRRDSWQGKELGAPPPWEVLSYTGLPATSGATS